MPDETESDPGALAPNLAARAAVVATLLVAALVTIVAARLILGPGQGPLPVLATLPPFELTDQLGRPAGSKELAGRPFAAGFIFTRCPSVCPALTARMRELHDRLEPSPDSALLVSISVDPEHDTPEVLARWAADQGIQAPGWLVLRGTPEATRALVTGGFLLALDDANRADPNALLHDTRLALVDRHLRIRGYYSSNEPERMDQLVRDLRRLAARDE